MEIDAEVLRQVTTRFEVLAPHLNERQRRLALATEARLLGHGGVRAVARAFAGFRFPPEVIVVAVRWYLRYNLAPAENVIRSGQAACSYS